jgi:hypothetical protein
MLLPRRLKRSKLGVQVPARKVWPRHRRWVKSHGCCVPECDATIVDFAHLRSSANAGMSQKPHDVFGVSLCRNHHVEQHQSWASMPLTANTEPISGRLPPSSRVAALTSTCVPHSSSFRPKVSRRHKRPKA